MALILDTGATSVKTYWSLRAVSDGKNLTGATVTGITCQTVRSISGGAADVVSTFTVGGAHSVPTTAYLSGYACEVSASNASRGLYRIDWPDSAFATGADLAVLSCSYGTTSFTEHKEVQFRVPVSVKAIASDAVTSMQSGIATAAELAKVPKSDSNVTFNATALASVKTQATSALSDINLDHLMKTPVSDISKLGDGGGNEVPDSTVLSLMLCKGADTDTFNHTTDSLEAIKDNTAWNTATSVTVSDKTGFALSATGADLILKSSTFVQAIVAAINEFATYGLTALNTLLVNTGIKTATTAAPADMATMTELALIHAHAAGAETQATTSATQATEANAHAHSVDGKVIGTIATGTHVAQTGDSFAIVNNASKGLVKVYDDMSKPGTAQTITAPADMALNSTVAKDATVAKATDLATVDTVVDAIKVQTDKLTFTVANKLDSNIKNINDTAVAGAGVTGNLWRPA